MARRSVGAGSGMTILSSWRIFSDTLIKAALATEDRRFFSHWGIDPIGTTRALVVNSRADTVVQGGSTITQQLAKNLFLTNERSLDRKIREAFLALWLEVQLDKEEILKLYLDRAYMGGWQFRCSSGSGVLLREIRHGSLPCGICHARRPVQGALRAFLPISIFRLRARVPMRF